MTEKLVRLIVTPEIHDSDAWRLPPGYDVIWHSDSLANVTREIVIKGDFPEFIPDCALVDCRVVITDTLMNELAFEWLYNGAMHRVQLPAS